MMSVPGIEEQMFLATEEVPVPELVWWPQPQPPPDWLSFVFLSHLHSLVWTVLFAAAETQVCLQEVVVVRVAVRSVPPVL